MKRVVASLAALLAVFVLDAAAAAESSLAQKLSTIRANVQSERAKMAELTAGFTQEKDAKRTRLDALNAELEETRARVAALAGRRAAPKADEEKDAKPAEPALTPEERAKLEAGLKRVVGAAQQTGEQLEFYLKEVPGTEARLETVSKALAAFDGDEERRADEQAKALATILSVTSDVHHEAAGIGVREADVWTARGERERVRLLNVGHAAYAYATLDGARHAVALESPTDTVGYRWNEDLDEPTSQRVASALSMVSRNEPGLLPVPLDISGQLRPNTVSSLPTAAELLEAGGYVMYPLAAVALLALLLILERGFVLYHVNGDRKRLRAKVMESCLAERYDEAETLCADAKGAVDRTLRALLGARDRGRAAMEESVQEQILHELPRLQRRMGGIAILAAVAPLLGLLGTVTGIIQTFRVIHSFGNANPGLLAGGISEALTTTAAGLCIAIPAFVIHSVLRGRLDGILSDAESQAATLLNTVSRQEANA